MRVLVSDSGVGAWLGTIFEDTIDNTWIQHECRNPIQVRGI